MKSEFFVCNSYEDYAFGAYGRKLFIDIQTTRIPKMNKKPIKANDGTKNARIIEITAGVKDAQ